MPTRLGETFEFDTPCGLAYFQVAIDHPRYKTLIRVLPGLYEARPDVAALVQGPERFKVFYPVASSVRQGLVTSLGIFSVPEDGSGFPLMKWPIGGEGHRYGWAIWDGQKELERRAALTDEQKAYPEPGIWNHALLVDNVASDWTWRDTAEPPPWRRLNRPPGCHAPFSDELDAYPEGSLVSHFLYFHERAAAISAQEAVRDTMALQRIEVMPPDDSGQVLLLVRHAPVVDPESLRRGFETIAHMNHGQYDGWEAPIINQSE